MVGVGGVGGVVYCWLYCGVVVFYWCCVVCFCDLDLYLEFLYVKVVVLVWWVLCVGCFVDGFVVDVDFVVVDGYFGWFIG